MKKEVSLLGYASGIAANNVDCGLGPWYLEAHRELFKQSSIEYVWKNIVFSNSELRGLSAAFVVADLASAMACDIVQLIAENKPFCVIGGDHSSALGTWSGVAHAYRKRGDIGLIWIDAHMDSHTPATSHTQNIHGMPLAHLLGYGIPALSQILDAHPKLKAENLCLIGVRSYEQGEENFLKQLGVKIIYMNEVKALGFHEALQEAIVHVSKNTCGFGISFDLDGFDPIEAPGVGCRVPGGLDAASVIKAFQAVDFSKLIALEIAEYNPILDRAEMTAKLIPQIIDAIYQCDVP